MRAEKLQSKAKKAGFDWADVSGAMDKLSEELAELKDAVENGGDVEEEIGDLLFSAVNVSRFAKVDAERALERTCEKFIHRFSYVEASAQKRGLKPEQLTLSELDKLWQEKKMLDFSGK
jgi:tetrapyrrole methylase family protein/MazG family protein